MTSQPSQTDSAALKTSTSNIMWSICILFISLILLLLLYIFLEARYICVSLCVIISIHSYLHSSICSLSAPALVFSYHLLLIHEAPDKIQTQMPHTQIGGRGERESESAFSYPSKPKSSLSLRNCHCTASAPAWVILSLICTRATSFIAFQLLFYIS